MSIIPQQKKEIFRKKIITSEKQYGLPQTMKALAFTVDHKHYPCCT